MAVNLAEHINKLKLERYLGSILFGEPFCGKTTYIKKFIKQYKELKVLYLDAQEHFVRHRNPEVLLSLPPKEFLEWIQKIIKKEIGPQIDAVFLDHIDALYNIWSPQKQNEFVNQRALRIEKAVFEIPIITLIQSDSNIEKLHNEQSSESLKRIIKFNELIHL